MAAQSNDNYGRPRGTHKAAPRAGVIPGAGAAGWAAATAALAASSSGKSGPRLHGEFANGAAWSGESVPSASTPGIPAFAAKRAASEIVFSGSTDLQEFSFPYLEACMASGELVGQGTFGVAFLARDTRIGGSLRRFFVKVLSRETAGPRPGKTLQSEVEVLRTFRHANIARLLGFAEQASKRALVYEDLQRGSLEQVLLDGDSAKKLTWTLRVRIADGVASALTYLHSNGTLHCDVKCGNIYLDGSYTAKLVGCGLSNFGEKGALREPGLATTAARGILYLGTAGYMCPKYKNSRDYGERCEVYSFGIVLMELLSGKVQSPVPQNCISIGFNKQYGERPKSRSSADDRGSLPDVLDNRLGENGWPEEVSSELAMMALQATDFESKVGFRPLLLSCALARCQKRGFALREAKRLTTHASCTCIVVAVAIPIYYFLFTYPQVDQFTRQLEFDISKRPSIVTLRRRLNSLLNKAALQSLAAGQLAKAGAQLGGATEGRGRF